MKNFLKTFHVRRVLVCILKEYKNRMAIFV